MAGNNVPKQAIKDACNTHKTLFSKDTVDIRSLRTRNIPHHRFIKTLIKSSLLDIMSKIEGFAVSKKRNKQQLNWILRKRTDTA